MLSVVLPFINSGRLSWLVDVPVGVTKEEGHKGFLHLSSAGCLPYFFSREGFSRSFPLSTVESTFVY